MMIEQDTMTSPFLPTDIAEAESAAEECPSRLDEWIRHDLQTLCLGLR